MPEISSDCESKLDESLIAARHAKAASRLKVASLACLGCRRSSATVTPADAVLSAQQTLLFM